LLQSRIQGLERGEYVLRWQVLASDGHITRGEVPFRVR
jgi:methionine-rich copper-binding protein CopC